MIDEASEERDGALVEKIAKALYQDFRIESEMTGEGCTSFEDHARLHPARNEPYWDAATTALRVSRSWQPIKTAPKRYNPPLSQYNHHAPQILGLWGESFYCVCSWGGPSQPYWIGGDNKKVPFQPTRWMPLPPAEPEGPSAGGEQGIADRR